MCRPLPRRPQTARRQARLGCASHTTPLPKKALKTSDRTHFLSKKTLYEPSWAWVKSTFESNPYCSGYISVKSLLFGLPFSQILIARVTFQSQPVAVAEEREVVAGARQHLARDHNLFNICTFNNRFLIFNIVLCTTILFKNCFAPFFLLLVLVSLLVRLLSLYCYIGLLLLYCRLVSLVCYLLLSSARQHLGPLPRGGATVVLLLKASKPHPQEILGKRAGDPFLRNRGCQKWHGGQYSETAVPKYIPKPRLRVKSRTHRTSYIHIHTTYIHTT